MKIRTKKLDVHLNGLWIPRGYDTLFRCISWPGNSNLKKHTNLRLYFPTDFISNKKIARFLYFIFPVHAVYSLLFSDPRWLRESPVISNRPISSGKRRLRAPRQQLRIHPAKGAQGLRGQERGAAHRGRRNGSPGRAPEADVHPAAAPAAPNAGTTKTASSRFHARA